MKKTILMGFASLTLSFGAMASDNIILNLTPNWECGPCNLNNSYIEAVGIEHSKSVILKNITIDDSNQYLLSDFEVTGYPTLVFLKDGEMVGKKTGFLMENQIVSSIEKAFHYDIRQDKDILEAKRKAQEAYQRKWEEETRAAREEARKNRLKRLKHQKENSIMNDLWSSVSGLRKSCLEGARELGFSTDIQNKLCKSNDPAKSMVCFIMTKRSDIKMGEDQILKDCTKNERPSFECVQSNTRRKTSGCGYTKTLFGRLSRWSKYKCDHEYSLTTVSSKRCEEMDSFLFDMNIK